MKRLFFLLYKVVLIPHLILYYFSKNKAIINQDLERWAKAKKITKGNLSLLLNFLTHSPDFRSIFYFRNRHNDISHILNMYCSKDTSFKIDTSTKLAGGILTGHPYSTILNAESIGKNFYVNHLVTVGEINGKRPTIGENVSIYTGAIVIGGIVLGDNCKIGAGAVVTKNVPANTTVVGNPAKILVKNNTVS